MVASNYFKKSGLDKFITKLESLDTKSMMNQIDIIRRSLIIHNNIDCPLNVTCKVNDSDMSLRHQINNYLENLNLEQRGNDYFAYIDYTITKDSQWTQYIQGSDLFQGLLGIGIFFLANYKESKNKNSLRHAENIFNQGIGLLEKNQLKLLDMPLASIGITHFPLSLLYYSLLSTQILNRKKFELSQELLFFIKEYLNNSIPKDRDLDYLFGSVGVALLLMAFDKYHGHQFFRKEINKIGQNIITKAEYLSENQVTWQTPSFNQWGGFGHGNSSFAYVLFKFFDYTSNSQYFELAVSALNYDQLLYDKEIGHWRKTHEFIGDIHQGWASGTAGIGLSRLLISQYFRNNFLNTEINLVKQKLETSLEYYLNIDHSICSGFLGMLEVYKTMFGKNDTYTFWLSKYLQKVKKFSDIKYGGWENNQVINGLYYGIAGVGYNLIKAQNENLKLPSLLWL